MLTRANLVKVRVSLGSDTPRHFSKKVATPPPAPKKNLIDELYARSNTPFVVNAVPEQQVESDRKTKARQAKAKRALEQKQKQEKFSADNDLLRTAAALSAAPIAPIAKHIHADINDDTANSAANDSDAALRLRVKEKTDAAMAAARKAFLRRGDNLGYRGPEDDLNSLPRPLDRPVPVVRPSAEELAALPPHIREARRKKIAKARDSLRQAVEALNRFSEFDDPRAVKTIIERELNEAAERREAVVRTADKVIAFDPLLQIESDGQVHNPLNVPGIPDAFRHRLPPELMGISPLTRKRLEQEGKTISEFRIPEYVLEARKRAENDFIVQTREGSINLGTKMKDYEAVTALREVGGKEYEDRMQRVIDSCSRPFSNSVIKFVSERLHDQMEFKMLLVSRDPFYDEHREFAAKIVLAIADRHMQITMEDVDKLPAQKRVQFAREVEKRLAKQSAGVGPDTPLVVAKPDFASLEWPERIEFIKEFIKAPFIAGADIMKTIIHTFSSKENLAEFLQVEAVKMQNRAARSRVKRLHAANRPPGRVNFPVKWFLYGMTFIIISFAMTTIWDYYMEMVHGITPPSAFSD